MSCEWLKAELDRGGGDPGLRLVDATWYLPNSPFAAPESSGGAQAEFLAGPRLPGSVFFDVDAVATPHSLGVPHMLPNEETFSAAMAALGIEPSTRVVVYDRLGMFSAPRLWYTMKVAFGHPGDVAVLDGGMPRWRELGMPLEIGEPPALGPPAPPSQWQRVPGSSWDLPQVRANIDSREALLLDARPAARFTGRAAEPRQGCRGGHVPGSVNMPFLDLLTAGPVRTMLAKGELDGRLREAGVPVDGLLSPEGGVSVVTSCGSGLTACIVGLALHQVGMPLCRWGIYDGSWAEWGMTPDTPVVKQGEDGQDVPVP